MDKKNSRKIYVASNSDLLDKIYYRRLWLSVRNVKIPRRHWLDSLADCFLSFDCKNGIMLWPDNSQYELPDLDEIFNGDDASMRWFGYYTSADKTKKHPQHRSRMIERLRLLDLYFRIESPEISRHFGR